MRAGASGWATETSGEQAKMMTKVPRVCGVVLFGLLTGRGCVSTAYLTQTSGRGGTRGGSVRSRLSLVTASLAALACSDSSGPPPPVEPTVAAIELYYAHQVIANSSVVFRAIPRDSGGNILTRQVTWTSTAESVLAVVATESLLDARFEARAPGMATISASREGVTTTAEIEILPAVRFTSIDLGRVYGCGVGDDERAYCFKLGMSSAGAHLGRGEDAGEEFGIGELTVPIIGEVLFESVSAGNGLTCGVTTNHEAYCWGRNDWGQAGHESYARNVWVPGPVGEDLSFKSVSAGLHVACGITLDHRAFCWGDNREGNLGSGTFEGSKRSDPVQVTGDIQWSMVTVTEGLRPNICGLSTEGVAYCWGRSNDYGQLGNGTVAASAEPVAVETEARFVDLSVTDGHSCGISEDGSAYCWGLNGGCRGWFGFACTETIGQLGVADAGDECDGLPCSLRPVRVETDVLWSDISVGRLNTCATAVGGELYCWGSRVWRGGHDGGPEPKLYFENLLFRSLAAAFALWLDAPFGGCGIAADGLAYCWPEAGRGLRPYVLAGQRRPP